MDERGSSLGRVGAAAGHGLHVWCGRKTRPGPPAATRGIRLFRPVELGQKTTDEKARVVLLLVAASLAPAGVINVEFKFTPFIGDPEKDEEVTIVAGKAQVFINNVPAS